MYLWVRRGLRQLVGPGIDGGGEGGWPPEAFPDLHGLEKYLTGKIASNLREVLHSVSLDVLRSPGLLVLSPLTGDLFRQL